MSISLYQDLGEVYAIVGILGKRQFHALEKNDQGRQALLPIDDVINAVLIRRLRTWFPAYGNRPASP